MIISYQCGPQLGGIQTYPEELLHHHTPARDAIKGPRVVIGIQFEWSFVVFQLEYYFPTYCVFMAVNCGDSVLLLFASVFN